MMTMTKMKVTNIYKHEILMLNRYISKGTVHIHIQVSLPNYEEQCLKHYYLKIQHQKVIFGSKWYLSGVTISTKRSLESPIFWLNRLSRSILPLKRFFARLLSLKVGLSLEFRSCEKYRVFGTKINFF